MFTVSCTGVMILLAVFVIFLAKAYIDDKKSTGTAPESKVKKMLTASRDQVIRGMIMGGLEGNPITALQGAVTWSLTSGVIAGISDLFGWHKN